MEEEVSLTVTLKPDDGGLSVFISYPKEQEPLSLSGMAKVLTSGISLVIKCANNDTEPIKDYEIMESVISQLNDDFISTKSFDNAKRLD